MSDNYVKISLVEYDGIRTREYDDIQMIKQLRQQNTISKQEIDIRDRIIQKLENKAKEVIKITENAIEAGITYKGTFYRINFDCYLEGVISIIITDTDLDQVLPIREFNADTVGVRFSNYLINEIDKYLEEE